jgi:hypothetical protein
MIKKCFVIILTLISYFAFSQDNENEYEKSKFAIQFGVSDFLKFSGYNGSMFSGKYCLSEKNAIQIGFSGFYDRPQSNNNNNNSNGEEYSTKDDERRYSISSSLCFVRYLKKTQPIYLYYGVGLNGYYSVEEKELNEYYTIISIKNIDYGFGLIGNLGVEWMVTNYISFFLEYGIGFRKSITEYKEEKTHDNYSEEKEKSGTKYSVYDKDILLGLSIHV